MCISHDASNQDILLFSSFCIHLFREKMIERLRRLNEICYSKSLARRKRVENTF